MSSQTVGEFVDSRVRVSLTNYGRILAIVCATAVASLLLVLSGCSSGASAVPAPGAHLSTSNLDFGSWKVSTTSAPQQLTLTNSGTATLTISGVTLGGTNASAFTMNNACGASLNPGASCAITVTFTPPGTSSVSASITIADSADNSPQTVGLSGSGSTLSGVAHGMFMLDPPNGDSNCNSPFPASCYSQHLLPNFICSGPGTPVGYGCKAQGAGWPAIDGAVFQIPWSQIEPSNGTFSFSGSGNAPDNRIQDWVDAGKLAALVFEPTSFGTASVANGNPNNATPGWYINPVSATISQSGGIIQVQNASGFAFLPGSVGESAGLEIQITGTGTALDSTSSNPGIYTICDHTHSGCQDPNANVIYAIGSGGNIGAVPGMVGNPVYGSADGSICTSGILPVEWRPNFIKAWQAVIAASVQYYSSNRSIAYMRFGMGVGGQTEPTNGLSSFDTAPNPTACQQQMTEFGFTSVAAPWPNPGDSSWSQVSENWISYLKSMLEYEQSLNSPHALILTLSPILYGEPEDTTTINATAGNAAAAGIGIGNQGLGQNDPTNYFSGQPCYGGNWCANFPKYASQVATTEQQTLSDSSPSGQTQNNMTGSLAGPPNLLTFATSLDTKVLELYFDDWMCTFDTSWSGENNYSACKNAGYPAAFAAAAAQIN